MTIEAGQPIPKATFQIKTDDGVDAHESTEYFASGRTILFALPGAFTSTCSAKHLPEFVARADDLRAAGVDRIACLSVNDAHVMKAWGDIHGTDGKIDMIADRMPSSRGRSAWRFIWAPFLASVPHAAR